MRRFINLFFVFLLLFSISQEVFALQFGILPKAPENNGVPYTEDDCNKWEDFQKYYDSEDKGNADLEDLLGCAIKTGKVRFFMVPYFITRLIEFLVSIAGLIAVLFIVIGGYKFVTGGIAEDKEAGKKTVFHAIVGLIVALSAYIIINFIQFQLTQ